MKRTAEALVGVVNTSTDCALVGATMDSSNAGVHCRWLKASTLTVAFEPALRRHEFSKLGQACSEQSRPTGRISSRSPLAMATGTLASTWGAKPGRTVRAAAMKAAIAIAESALIMEVPCYPAEAHPARFVVG